MSFVEESLSNWPAWMVWVGAGYATFLIAIAVYDVRRRRIPNAAVYPAIAAALLVALIRPDGTWWSFVVAGLAAGGFFIALSAVSRGAMGGGDVKLALLIGLAAGWPGVLVAVFVAFAVGAGVGVLLIALGRLGRRDSLPFAPALAVGAATAALLGRQMVGLLWPGIAP
jgi:prepilin signal peptidase PulO-like enzyme (type II secretory pathway)